MTRILDVYLHEQLTGTLTEENGDLSFLYNPHAKIAVSYSLPLQDKPHRGQAVKAFFSGLLPDDIVRHRLARVLGVSAKNSFSLLESVGGECAGALALYPAGQKPPSMHIHDVEVLNEERLITILALLRRRPLLAGTDNMRLSLAGAQDKLAVGLKDGAIALVRGTTPTTHILKPALEDIEGSVHNEWFCLRLAAMMGLETADASLHHAGDQPFLLIKRYDRTAEGIRLHQEDFCQALSIVPEKKYQREGGPSVADSLGLIAKTSYRPAADRLAFLRRVIVNVLIGNADAHGKNAALLYEGDQARLAPAYDLLCTAVYPTVSQNMAMKIGGHYRADTLCLRHWHHLVPNTILARKALEKDMGLLATIAPKHAMNLRQTMAAQGHDHPILDKITTLIHQRAHHIQQDIPD